MMDGKERKTQMKNLAELVLECKMELDNIGIKFGTIRNWSINTRAKCRWGQCKRIYEDVFDISIAQRLLEDDVDDIATKNTIIHELLHTVDGCSGHKGKWKRLAEQVNAASPEYNIKRTTSAADKGVPSVRRPYRKKYKITCKTCGVMFYRQKASRVVVHPEKYRCSRCGGKFEVVSV